MKELSPLLVIVAIPAVELSVKVKAEKLLIVAVPAVDELKNDVVAPISLRIVAVPAVELSVKVKAEKFLILAVPAVDELKNDVVAPISLRIVAVPAVELSVKVKAEKFLILAVPAVDELKNDVVAPMSLRIVAVPAVELSVKVKAEKFLILAVPAVDELKNDVVAPMLLRIVAVPAVAIPKNNVVPGPLMIVCTFVELFTIPTPWRIRLPGTAALVPCAGIPTRIVKAFAPGLKVMDSTVLVLAEIVGVVFVEMPKAAVSPGLTGAFVGDQLAPVFQLELTPPSQVASTASAEVGPAVNNSGTHDAPMTANRTSAATNSPIAVARKRRNLLASLVVIFFPIIVSWDV